MNKPAKSQRSDRNRKAAAAVQKHFGSMPAIVLDGVTYTPAEVVAELQSAIDAADATIAAAGAHHQAVLAERATAARTDALYAALKSFTLNQHKPRAEVLAEFGMTLPSRQAPSAETLAAAAEKRAATRAARHTMGKRQKMKVKGAVPGGEPPSQP